MEDESYLLKLTVLLAVIPSQKYYASMFTVYYVVIGQGTEERNKIIFNVAYTDTLWCMYCIFHALNKLAYLYITCTIHVH